MLRQEEFGGHIVSVYIVWEWRCEKLIMSHTRGHLCSHGSGTDEMPGHQGGCTVSQHSPPVSSHIDVKKAVLP